MRELMSNAVSVEEQEQLASLVESGESTPQSLKLDWGERTFSVSYAPVQAETAEEQLGSVVVFRDFTSEAQLNRMKSALLSMASHELRTPLNAILGYADMLKEGVMGTVNAEQTLTLRRMMANVNRMLGLVNNLLDQARAEAGRLEAELAPFEVSTLFEDLTSSMQVLAENKHITLTLEVSEGLPEVLVSDAGRVRQIATNLIGNAIKFTDEGEVRVRVSRAGAGQWSFAVRDTGEGIPAEAQQYIFDTFRQVGDPTTRRHGGSGLGLSIVQQLVDLLDGKIEVESTVGAGSTFCVTLPLKETS
jgi:signal transduction histidine kinase